MLFVLFVLFAVLAGSVVVALRVLYHSLTFFFGNAEEIAAVMSEQIINFSLYPACIFSGPANLVLHSLIPAAFVAYLPAQVFGHFNADTLDGATLALVIAGDLAVIVVAWVVFRLGLRRYESGNQIGARL